MRLRYLGTLQWAILRKRYTIATLLAIQVLFAVAVLWGLPMLTGTMPLDEAAIILGVWHLGIIAIGLTLAPQMVSDSENEGYFSFLKNFPISRSGIFITEIFSWLIVSLPGLLIVPILGSLKHGWEHVVPMYSKFFIVVALEACYLSLGIMLALCFKLEIVQVVSQLLMLFAMLFTPILFPESHLPAILAHTHRVLPFDSGQRLLLSQNMTNELYWCCIVVGVWFLLTASLGTAALEKKR